MTKDPAILFYTSDFLIGTMLMTNEQVGIYIRLLCMQHQQEKLREKDMSNICKSYDEDIYQKFKKDDDGNYYNERLRLEMSKRKSYSESRKNNRLGKTEGSKSKSKDMKNICKSHDSHMVNENINEIVNTIEVIDNKNNTSLDFIQFQNWIQTNAPRVALMEEPFTQVEYERIISKYDIRDIKRVLLSMHNYKDLVKKSISSSLTLQNWLKRDLVPGGVGVALTPIRRRSKFEENMEDSKCMINPKARKVI